MNPDTFNMSIRKFLKMVGVQSQREIETAVESAIATGKLKGAESLPASTINARGCRLSKFDPNSRAERLGSNGAQLAHDATARNATATNRSAALESNGQ